MVKGFFPFCKWKNKVHTNSDGCPKTKASWASLVLLLVSWLSCILSHKINLPISARESSPSRSYTWTYSVLSQSKSEAGWDVWHTHRALSCGITRSIYYQECGQWNELPLKILPHTVAPVLTTKKVLKLCFENHGQSGLRPRPLPLAGGCWSRRDLLSPCRPPMRSVTAVTAGRGGDAWWESTSPSTEEPAESLASELHLEVLPARSVWGHLTPAASGRN